MRATSTLPLFRKVTSGAPLRASASCAISAALRTAHTGRWPPFVRKPAWRSCRSAGPVRGKAVPYAIPDDYGRACSGPSRMRRVFVWERVTIPVTRALFQFLCPSSLPLGISAPGRSPSLPHVAQILYFLLGKAGITRYKPVEFFFSKRIDKQHPVITFFIEVAGDVRIIDKYLYSFFGLFACLIMKSVYFLFSYLHKNGRLFFKLPPAANIKSECIEGNHYTKSQQYKYFLHTIPPILIHRIFQCYATLKSIYRTCHQTRFASSHAILLYTRNIYRWNIYQKYIIISRVNIIGIKTDFHSNIFPLSVIILFFSY